jgi:hydrogenase maturation protein HypF
MAGREVTHKGGVMAKVRAMIQIEGVVQGVGFRPFVYALAQRHVLTGWVLNDEKGVQIEVEGEGDRVTDFLSGISSPPLLAHVERQQVSYLPLAGYQGFEIRPSTSGDERLALISPDMTTCGDCRQELFDSQDRRFRYPFINCTNCGPRFTIIEDIPYDRAKTTMASFEMCAACSAEYHNPADRRFHAQPNACPACGPQVKLLDNTGTEVGGVDPLRETLRLLKEGRIVAIKGLGGFHLACDAAQEAVVTLLRRRKYREDKPFALMCKDLEVIERMCVVDDGSRELLASKERPIVILPRQTDNKVALSAAPGQGTLGVMLPYTPLHHLLLADGLASLVMTSGNRGDEPIAYRNAEALERLGTIADFFLVHNREIHTRCDDSVVKPFRGRPTFMRRARGFVPFPIRLQRGGKSVLACGAEGKNTFCLTKGNYAFLSHHIGDLENYETMQSFEQGIDLMMRLFKIEPAAVVHDLHPDYLSTRYALGYARGREVPRIGVQHHFAHALSCMAEYGLEGPVLAVVMDGTGYGGDETVWGGEFLEVTSMAYTRLGHLRSIPLPGGDKGAKEPWRMAAVYLDRIYGRVEGVDIPFAKGFDLAAWSLLREAMQANINSPLCSSIGRLFDAVSALIGVRQCTNYEGQAAIELEQMARQGEQGEYPFEIAEEEGTGALILNPDPLIAAVVEDIKRKTDPAIIAARFHNAMAKAIARMATRMREATGLSEIVLSGGVFQNHLLMGRAVDLLEKADFKAYIHRQVPANDGGIALGQALHALCLLGED